MQPDIMDDDNSWNDLDDNDLASCLLMENEALSQNPSVQRKPFNNNYISQKKTANNWVNLNSNSFISHDFGPTSHSSTSSKLNNVGLHPSKNASNSRINSSPKSFSKINSKSNNFYKPLQIGPSPNSNNINKNLSEVDDLKSLQMQLEMVLKDKSKLEEDNLVKQGEIANLRCEIKRKEINFETQRMDQFVALEAAETKGKEKASRTLVDMECKVKQLKKEVDKLQGNISFKNREVDELTEKCSRLERVSSHTRNDSFRAFDEAPSPKRRRTSLKTSPNKSMMNFGDRFDFGDVKKSVKHAFVQTDTEYKEKKKEILQVQSDKGRASEVRKASYLLSTSNRIEDSSFPGFVDADTSSFNQSNLIAQMISPGFSESSGTNMMKFALEKLKKIQEEIGFSYSHRVGDGERKEIESLKSKYELHAIFLLNFLSMVEIRSSETTLYDAIKYTNLILTLFLEKKINVTGIAVSLQACSSLSRMCSFLPSDISNDICESLKKCCQVSSEEIINIILSTVNSLNYFEKFKQIMCLNKSGECLVKLICGVIQSHNNIKWTRLCNYHFLIFVSQLLQDPHSIVKHTEHTCNCETSLLTTFVNHLYKGLQHISIDSDWDSIISGLEVLHLWLSKDKSWWDRVSHLHSYTALLSTVVTKSKDLKNRGIIDQHTWKLLCDLYSVDETAF